MRLDLLLFVEHLRGVLVFLVLEKAVDQLVARVFLPFGAGQRVGRQQHLRLDVNQHRGHIDELGRNVYIQFAELFDVCEVLAGDLGDRDIVDIDVLFADEVEQQVERAFVDIAHADGKGEIALFFARVGSDQGGAGRQRGVWRDGLGFEFGQWQH